MFQVCVMEYSVWQPNFLRFNGFMTNFFNPVYFGSNVVSAKCPFLDVFRPFVLSAICPFRQMSFGYMLIRPNVFRSYVFQSYVCSVICLSAICPSTKVYIGETGCDFHVGLGDRRTAVVRGTENKSFSTRQETKSPPLEQFCCDLSLR